MKKLLVLFMILLFQYSLPYALSADSTIKVGVYNNEPLLFADADGRGKGVFADIIEHVASKEGWQIEYVTGTWDQCLSWLENNQIDILGTIAFTKARDKLYDFGKENLMTNWGQLYTPAGSGIKGITDVAGKKVAVLKGDIHYRVFAQIIERFGIECKFIETDNYRSVLDLVSRNQAESGVVNRFFGMKYGSRYKLDKSGVIFNPIKLYYAVPEGKNSELVDTVDRYIVLLKGNENSEYYRSLDRWFEAVSAKRTFPQWAKWTVLAASGLFVFSFLGNLILKIQIKAKTKELTTELNRRKKAEETLRKSEMRFRTIYENAPVLIDAFDENGRCVLWNKQCRKTFGWTIDEINAHDDTLEVFYPDPAVRDEVMRTVTTDPDGHFREWNPLTKDGKMLTTMWANFRFPDGVAFNLGHDITERKRVEEKLKKYQDHLEELVKGRTNELKEKTDKIEESRKALTYLVEDVNNAGEELRKVNMEYAAANKELKEFAYIVSHDLKAPLRAISQLTHWISEDYSEAFDDDGKKQMDLILKRVKRMDGLIEGILRYSRIGRIREKEGRLDLNLIVKNIIDALSPPDNVKIIIENELPDVLRDSVRMEQVFQNLIGNAIKFMDKEEGIIKVGCADEGAFWKFSVSDNGPGIDKRYHDKIFRIFQTLVPRDEHESTGIGLTLVKKIIKLYGGSIWVESETGCGTTFFFTLPKKGEKDEKL